MDGSVLLMPFLDESESFTNGFAMGILWHQCTNNEIISEKPLQMENKEQTEMIMQHFGYDYTIKDADENWFYLEAKPIDISEINKVQ